MYTMYHIDMLLHFRATGHKIDMDSVNDLLPTVEQSWTSGPTNQRATTGNGGDSRSEHKLNQLSCLLC